MQKLMELAKAESILWSYVDFPWPLRGIYIESTTGMQCIGIAKDIDTLAERRSVFAEELGHHFTSVGNAIECHCYADRLNIGRVERKAMVWAVNYLIPEEKLLDVLTAGVDECWELAEYFTVTEKFMQFRLRLFKGCD